MFQLIYCVLIPNDESEQVFQTPNFIKKIKKVDATCITTKRVPGWIIETLAVKISLLTSRLNKVCLSIDDFPKSQLCTSRHKLDHLFGILRNIALTLPGEGALFSYLQAALHGGTVHLRLVKAMHAKLVDCVWIIDSIANRPTHMSEVVLPHLLLRGSHRPTQVSCRHTPLPPHLG